MITLWKYGFTPAYKLTTDHEKWSDLSGDWVPIVRTVEVRRSPRWTVRVLLDDGSVLTFANREMVPTRRLDKA